MQSLKVFMVPIAKRAKCPKYAYIIAPNPYVNNRTLQPQKNEFQPWWKKLVKAAMQKMNDRWKKCEAASPVSMEGRFFSFVNHAKSKLDPHELLMVELRESWKNGFDIAIQYPACIERDVIMETFHTNLRTLKSQNTMYMIGYISALPITLPFLLIPFPNVPFFIILMRLYHLFLAQSSVRFLLRRLEQAKSADAMIYAGNTPDHVGVPRTGRGRSQLLFNRMDSPPMNWVCKDPSWSRESVDDGEVVVMSQEDIQKLSEEINAPSIPGTDSCRIPKGGGDNVTFLIQRYQQHHRILL